MEFFTPGHLVVLAVAAAILLFGSKQLPDMARSLGQSLRIFKTEIKSTTSEPAAEAAPAPRPIPVGPNHRPTATPRPAPLAEDPR